jgi:hypothetical protein
MISFLAGLPLWLSGLLVVGLPTVLAMFGPVLVRRYVPLEKLEKNNEVGGFQFATVGVLYAVLLAFAIIVVWEGSATLKPTSPRKQALQQLSIACRKASLDSPASRSVEPLPTILEWLFPMAGPHGTWQPEHFGARRAGWCL